LRDRSPLVRRAACEAAGVLPVAERRQAVMPLLQDSRLIVRLAAFGQLMAAYDRALAQHASWQDVRQEYLTHLSPTCQVSNHS
jgi:HEAT repeat protein